MTDDEPCVCDTDFTCLATTHDAATPALRVATTSPLVQGYLHSLAAVRPLVRLRDGRIVELWGVNRGCTRAKVRHHNRWLQVDVGVLAYVIDPTDPDENREP